MLEMEHIREQIAAEVRAEIARQGLTYAEIAESAGVARSTFASKAKGLQGFSVDELIRVADALGVSAADLIASVLANKAAS